MTISPDKTHWILDIETLPNCIIFCFEDYASDTILEFVLWKNRNDLPALFNFLHRNIRLNEKHITYNGLAFDSQIIQWMLDYEDYLLNCTLLTTDQVIDEIYKIAQDAINRSNGKEFGMYAEWKLLISQIDLFKLNHWDNPQKRASLKWVACSIDWPDIQDMPYHHTHYVESAQQLEEIKGYCFNDVHITKKILYLSKEGVDLRRSLSKEYNVNIHSASEPRMAKELFLYFLSKKLRVERKELKKWSTFREEIKVEKIILPFIKFQKQQFTMLLNNFKKLTINGAQLRGAFKYNVKYNGLSIDYGLGGIHAFSQPGKYYSKDDWTIMSSDVKSYYPNLAIKNRWSPAHIPNKEFCEQYEAFYNDRLKFKKGTAKNYLYKILLNSTFGLSIDQTSFLSDPELGCKITINGQLLLSMLIEMLSEQIPEAKPIMMNTDGLEVLVPNNKKQKYLDICKEWENMTNLELEHSQIKSLFAYDCNNYISLLENNELKCKGRFEFEAHDKYDTNVLHKNKSFLIVPKALFAYFTQNTPIEDFVKNHRNIYDFCGYARATGEFKFYNYQAGPKGVEKSVIQKTLRYFISNDGAKVIKFHEGDGRKMQLIAGSWAITNFNKFEEKSWNEYDIDYSYYIKEIKKEIRILEKEQLNLFEL